MINTWNSRPVLISLGIGVAVFVVTALFWQLGFLQPGELWIYDHFVAARSDPNAVDDRFVIVLQSEQDITRLDFPLRDNVLANVLDKIEEGNPVVVGLDLFRNLPEPRDGSEAKLLAQTLLAKGHENILTIFLTGTKSSFLISPPDCLINDATRYGFNNFPNDGDNVRRAYILEKPDKNTYNSFAWGLAQVYLGTKGIQPSREGHSIRLGKAVVTRFHGSDGAYIDADDVGYQFLQDFRGPRKFKTMSVQDVIDLKDTGIFKDKIVLIGSGAESSNDVHVTPLDPFASGTVIHAQIVNQLLRAALDGDRPTESASLFLKWFSLFLCCLLGILAGFRVKSYVLFAVALILGAIAIVASGWWLFLAGYWTVIVAPLLAFLATSIFVKGYAATHEEEKRADLMKLFSQHISTDIAEEIWSQRHLFLKGGRPAAQRLMVTVLFTDLKNYSAISEKMSPAELIAWINECISRLAQHVGKNGGIINSYMGDGMMAVFGVPVARSTDEEKKRDATNAVRCALNMAAEIKKMNALWEKEGKPLAGLRVGIYTGEAMAGVLGSEDHLEYSVIGDTVNTASRLESVDKEELLTGASGDCRILIGALTHSYIEEAFPTKFVGEINLKGKKEMTKVYKVLDRIEDIAETQKRP